MSEKKLNQFLSEKIPVTKALGVEVIRAKPSEIRIRAPLKLNHNHMDTAFGGSLSTLMILACYSWLYTLLEQNEANFHIVIKDAVTKYMAPVKEDIVAVCHRPENQEIDQFLQAYQRKGIARIRLSSYIEINGSEQACTLDGVFVAKV